MKRNFMLVLIFSIFAGFLANASIGQEGNGGDAIYCPNRSDDKVMLVDFYEARSQYQLTQDLGSDQWGYEKKVDYALERLAARDAVRAERYRQYWANFKSEVLFTNDDLVDVPDTGNARIPAGCQIKQWAVQSEPIFAGDKRYTIDQKLWDIARNSDRAGLILHEIVLRDARNLKQVCGLYGCRSSLAGFHLNTRRIRYFVGNISSPRILKMAVGEYVDVVNAAAQPPSISFNKVNCTWSQSINDKAVSGDFKYHDANRNIIEECSLSGPHEFELKFLDQVVKTKSSQVGFASSGLLSWLSNSSLSIERIVVRLKTNLGPLDAYIYGSKIFFNKDFVVQSIKNHSIYADLSTATFSGLVVISEINLIDGQYQISKFQPSGGCSKSFKFFQGGQWFVDSFNTTFNLDNQGKMICLSVYRRYEYDLGFKLNTKYGPLKYPTNGYSVKTVLEYQFFPDGSLKRASFDDANAIVPWDIKLDKVKMTIVYFSTVKDGKTAYEYEFHPNGVLKKARSSVKEFKLLNSSGEKVKIPPDTNFILNDLGQVICSGNACE